MTVLPESIGRLSLRPVTEADDEFIFQTIKATMADYVAATYGPWDDQQQRGIIKENTDYKAMRAIVWAGKEIGLVTATVEADCIKLSQLYLLPEHQGQRLGSLILDNLKQVATKEQMPLRLSVLASNRKARRMYEREGFTIYERTDRRTRMEFRP